MVYSPHPPPDHSCLLLDLLHSIGLLNPHPRKSFPCLGLAQQQSLPSTGYNTGTPACKVLFLLFCMGCIQSSKPLLLSQVVQFRNRVTTSMGSEPHYMPKKHSFFCYSFMHFSPLSLPALLKYLFSDDFRFLHQEIYWKTSYLMLLTHTSTHTKTVLLFFLKKKHLLLLAQAKAQSKW